MESIPQDDAEAYREEYVRKFWEKKNRERARKKKRQDDAYRFFRMLAFPIAFFAFVLIIDEWLPARILSEQVVSGGQEYRGSTKRRVLVSYMRTESLFIQVPHEAHLKYPYSDEWRPPLHLRISRIFSIPLSAAYSTTDVTYTFDIPGTIFNMFIPLRWLLLISAVSVCFAKNYTKYSWSIAFMPTILFLITWFVISNS